MMRKLMMLAAIILLAAGGYFGYQRYMNQDNVQIQSCSSPSKSNCYCLCGSSPCDSSTGTCNIY